VYSLLKYKLKEKGITIEKVDESYTTQTCPVCGNRKKSKKRNNPCKCGYKEHRDIHGARNDFSNFKKVYCTTLAGSHTSRGKSGYSY
jgi:putative transposase